MRKRLRGWVNIRCNDSELRLTYNCGVIQTGCVESVSPVELTTSPMETPQTRRSCANSLESFAQSFFHRAQREVPGLPWVSLPTFSFGLQIAAWPNQRSLLWASCSLKFNGRGVSPSTTQYFPLFPPTIFQPNAISLSFLISQYSISCQCNFTSFVMAYL